MLILIVNIKEPIYKKPIVSFIRVGIWRLRKTLRPGITMQVDYLMESRIIKVDSMSTNWLKKVPLNRMQF